MRNLKRLRIAFLINRNYGSLYSFNGSEEYFAALITQTVAIDINVRKASHIGTATVALVIIVVILVLFARDRRLAFIALIVTVFVYMISADLFLNLVITGGKHRQREEK